MKFCINCKHFSGFNKCMAQPFISRVTGVTVPRDDWRGSASLQRHDNLIMSLLWNSCGKYARFFEAK